MGNDFNPVLRLRSLLRPRPRHRRVDDYSATAMATTTRSISSSSVEGHLVSVAVEEGMHEAENVPPLLFRKRLLFRGVGRERGETFSLFSCAPKKPVVLPKSFLRCLILRFFFIFWLLHSAKLLNFRFQRSIQPRVSLNEGSSFLGHRPRSSSGVTTIALAF